MNGVSDEELLQVIKEKSKVGIPNYGSLDIEWIKEDPTQPRKEENYDIDELAKQLKGKKGDSLFYPITVESIGNGLFLIIDGHRRFRAAKKAGWKRMPCNIKVDLDDNKRLEMRLKIDINAKSLTVEERREAWKKLYQIKHEENCGCDREKPRRCKYSITKFSTDMKINKMTLSRYLVTDVTDTQPLNTINKTKGAYTERGKGKAYIHPMVEIEVKKKLDAMKGKMSYGELFRRITDGVVKTTVNGGIVDGLAHFDGKTVLIISLE